MFGVKKKRLVYSPNPKEEYERIFNDLKDVYELRKSKKHMANLDMSQFEGKSYLEDKYVNVA